VRTGDEAEKSNFPANGDCGRSVSDTDHSGGSVGLI
jgi:hypothetical protein